MNTTYKFVVWAFDTARFASAVKDLHEHFSWAELSQLLDVSKSTLNNWANGNFSPEFPFPHMSNFLHICNELDLDPREFFVIEET